MLKPLMTVDVYYDPITAEDYEGSAKLIREIRPDMGDGLSMWEVEFTNDPHYRHVRTINLDNAI